MSGALPDERREVASGTARVGELDARAKFACPCLRRRSGLESGEAEARLPVLRHRVAGEARRRTAPIVEHDLVAALRGITDDARGWKADKRQVRCQSCNAISVLDPKRQAQNCEFCGSAQLVPYEETKPAFRPESVLPFAVSAASARDRIRAWYGKLWLAPSALKRRALTDTVHGLYLPYWTFDAQVDAQWTAEAGHYYYTTETYIENGQTRTRQVRHVRWEPAAGRRQPFLRRRSRLRVGRRASEPAARHRAVSDAGRSSPTTPGFVAGWVVERYQIDLVGAAQRARAAMDAKLQQLCAQQVPGRHVPQSRSARALFAADVQAHPGAGVAADATRYGAKAFQCVKNGVTGAIAGEYPKSPWKIALIVLAVIVFVADRHVRAEEGNDDLRDRHRGVARIGRSDRLRAARARRARDGRGTPELDAARRRSISASSSSISRTSTRSNRRSRRPMREIADAPSRARFAS